MKEFKAPVRIDLAGGWTDIPFLIQGTTGFVVNVAINPLVMLRGDDKEPDMNGYPRGTGLATSTAVKMLEMIRANGGVKSFSSAPESLARISEQLFALENKELSWAIGRQDMYAIAHGGLNCFRFNQNSAEVMPICIEPRILKRLEKRLLLFYSGVSRNAQVVVEEVYRQFVSNECAREALRGIGECALRMIVYLADDNLDECGYIMSDNWRWQKILAPSSSNAELDAMYQFARENGALGGKICGAGGGGAFVFYAKRKEQLQEKLQKRFPDGYPIPFSFEYRNIIELNS